MHKRWDIDGLFDELVISAEVGLVKPDARVFQLALGRLDVQPHEAVFIDDMPVNVDAAGRLGMIGIQFVDTRQTLSELQSILELVNPIG